VVSKGPILGDDVVRGRTMAEFKKVVPVLNVSDMQKAVAFYSGVLGFTVVWRSEVGRAEKGEVALM
jgi:predicted enzyme related to lactoylglutathione lyase